MWVPCLKCLITLSTHLYETILLSQFLRRIELGVSVAVSSSETMFHNFSFETKAEGGSYAALAAPVVRDASVPVALLTSRLART